MVDQYVYFLHAAMQEYPGWGASQLETQGQRREHPHSLPLCHMCFKYLYHKRLQLVSSDHTNNIWKDELMKQIKYIFSTSFVTPLTIKFIKINIR